MSKFAITQQNQGWNIPKALLNSFDTKEIEHLLSAINRGCSGHFYMADYCHEKFIVDSPYSLILCGHPRSKIEEMGFRFFDLILKEEELEWIHKMNVAGYKTLFRYPPSKRLTSIISYDFTVKMANGEELILHHKVIPYKLCKNGNMWLALCYTALSSAKKPSERAVFYNTKTGDRYDLIDGEFVLADIDFVSPLEVQILKWMSKDYKDYEMASLIENMTLGNFKRKKKELIKKLGAKASAGAVHNAHLMGIISNI
jgi:hypothetical protein